MTVTNILDLRAMVLGGQLFRSPADGNRIEAFIPPMGHENHAANMVELSNGDLVCVWFAGSMEGISDVKIAMSRLPAGEARWTQPTWVSGDPQRSEQNPLLFPTPDGKLWLLYTAQLTRGGTREEWARKMAAGEASGDFTMQYTSIIRRRISEDGGHTWGPVEVFSGEPGSFCRQPMLVMSNGEWLFPMYYSLPAEGHADDYCAVRISADGFKTWQEHSVPASRGRVQMSVAELAPGRLVAFFRSRAADRIYLSCSADYGRTWTAPVRTVLPNNNSSIQALKLHSECIAIIFNHVSANDDPAKTVWPRERYPVTLALSEDGGETWPIMRHVDTGDDFAGTANKHLNRRCGYPCILQTSDGLIHVGYSYRPRQCIKYVRFTEAWIREQQDSVFGHN
jgi:predicted neuraminidase